MKRIFSSTTPWTPALLFDTNRSELVCVVFASEHRWRFRRGAFARRTEIVEESLYRTSSGRWFLVARDGDGDRVYMLTKRALRAWILKRCPSVEVAIEAGAFSPATLVDA